MDVSLVLERPSEEKSPGDTRVGGLEHLDQISLSSTLVDPDIGVR